MFQATRIIQSKSPKIPLLINCEGGVTTNEQEQVKKHNSIFSQISLEKNIQKNYLTFNPVRCKNHSQPKK